MRAAWFWLLMVSAAVGAGSIVTDSHPLRMVCAGLTFVAGVVWLLAESTPEPLAPYSPYQGLDE